MTQNTSPKEIICKLDSTNNQVVFVLDTLNIEKRTIGVWKGNGKTIETMSWDYYNSSSKLSEVDQEAIAAEFEAAVGLKNGYKLRSRLFRTNPHNDHRYNAHVPNDFDKKAFILQINKQLKDLQDTLMKLAA